MKEIQGEGFFIEPMIEAQIEEVCQLAYDSYKFNSPIVLNGYSDALTIKNNERDMLKYFFEAQQIINGQLLTNTIFNFVHRKANRIIGAFSTCEFNYYVDNIAHKNDDSRFYQVLRTARARDNRRIGQSIFERRLFVNRDMMGQGLGRNIFLESSLYLLSQKYCSAYGFATNPATFSIVSKLNGHALVQHEDVKDNKSTIITFYFRQFYKNVRLRTLIKF